MVDCTNSRCAQDRRIIKKELLSWTKKVPLLVGLEQVANVVAGKRLMKELLRPFNDLEPSGPVDWNSEEGTCCFCATGGSKGDKDMVSDADGDSTHHEAMATATNDLLHTGPSHFPFKYFSSKTESQQQDENAPLDLSMSASQPQDVKSHKEARSAAVLQKSGCRSSKRKDGISKKSYTEEELCAAVHDIRTGKLGTRRAAALYGIPRSTLRNKIFRMESSGAAAAAAAAAEGSSGSGVGEGGNGTGRLMMSDLLQGMAANGAGTDFVDPLKHLPQPLQSLSATDWEQRLEQLRGKHDFQARLDRPFGMPPLFYNSMYMRQCEKAFAGCDPYAYDLKLPFLTDLVRKFASQRMEFEARNSLQHHTDMMTFLSSHKAFTPATPTEPPAPLLLNKGGICLGEPITSPASSRSSSVELKIPSYKPMRLFGSQTNGLPERYSPLPGILDNSALNPSSSTINGTLKDIISKTITEKVKDKVSPFSGASSQSGSLPSEYGENNMDDAPHSSDDSLPPARKKLKTSNMDSDGGDGKHEDGDQKMATKKTRPKRGQYRKYNSQLLVEAVKAVQRGEMSVHRAGSYFGVPHSTLEYKVKERHLLRLKKPREPKTKKSGNSHDSAEEKKSGSSEDGREHSCNGSTEEGRSPSPDAISSSSGLPVAGSLHPNTAAAAAASMPVFPMSGSGLPLGFGWPLMLGSGGGLPAPQMPSSEMPSFLPNFGLNTSASELLKKLQRKVQAQEAITSLPRSSPRDDPESEGPKSEEEGVRATSSSQVAVN